MLFIFGGKFKTNNFKGVFYFQKQKHSPICKTQSTLPVFSLLPSKKP